MDAELLIDRLCECRSLGVDEYEQLIESRTPELAEELGRRIVVDRGDPRADVAACA